MATVYSIRGEMSRTKAREVKKKKRGSQHTTTLYTNAYKLELYHKDDGKFLKGFNQAREIIKHLFCNTINSGA